jgi:simple sugar transport system substrate-binding protein
MIETKGIHTSAMCQSRILASSLTLFAAVALVGCGSSDSTGPAAGGPKSTTKQLVIGFAQTGAESGWRKAETQSVKDEAAKRGIDLKFVDGQGRQELQIQAIHNFITQKVDGIILAPITVDGFEPVLKEAKAAGIPVVLSDRAVQVKDDSLYVTLVGSDFVEEGRRCAEYLGKALKGKGNIAEIEGNNGSAPQIERKKGFEEVLAQKYPGIKIIADAEGKFEIAKGKEVMEAMLRANGKNINAVFCHNDDMGLGAIQAIQEAGLKPGKDVLIASIDGEKLMVQQVANGNSNCCVECKALLGPGLFDAVQQAVNKKTLPKKMIQQDDQFDETNAKKLVDTRQY